MSQRAAHPFKHMTHKFWYFAQLLPVAVSDVKIKHNDARMRVQGHVRAMQRRENVREMALHEQVLVLGP